MESIRRLLSTLSSIATTRLELLLNEWQEERLRLMQMLFFALSALFCLGMGILLFTVFIVVLFWNDEHRLLILGVLSIFFFGSGAILALQLRSKSPSQLFSASLAELHKDREQLKP